MGGRNGKGFFFASGEEVIEWLGGGGFFGLLTKGTWRVLRQRRCIRLDEC